MIRRRGGIILTDGAYIGSFASAVGKKEGEGPLKNEFDRIFKDTTAGQDSWERSESAILREAIEEIRVQTHKMETVYYLYVLDAEGRLAGVVSAKDLLRRIGEQDVKIKEFMKSAQSLVTVNANQKREDAVLLYEGQTVFAELIHPRDGA